jgi:hypothetical protein
MAGAVRIDEIEAILEAVPDEDLPYSKSYLIDQVLAVLLTPDYDTDGDGVDDAVTVGLHIGAVGAEILGVAEACTGDADCDDGNPCTDGVCDEFGVCNHDANSDPCDNPPPGSTDGLCEGGECKGALIDCGFALDDSSEQTLRVSGVQWGDATVEEEGQGLNVDGLATCAPAPCSAGTGIDNQASILKPLLADPEIDIDTMFAENLADGSVHVLMDLVGLNAEGTPFGVNFYHAALFQTDPPCDFTAEDCDYSIGRDNLDRECGPLYQLDNAVLDGFHLTAGGPGYDILPATTS